MANNKRRNRANRKNKNPSASGQGGGQGDMQAKSDNPQDWKNEPGNQS